MALRKREDTFVPALSYSKSWGMRCNGEQLVVIPFIGQ